MSAAKKYLGIDFGDVRIGTALAGDGIALPYRIINNDGTALRELGAIVTAEHITDIVVGWPKSMSGAENERTRKTAAFIEDLRKHCSVSVHRFDERLTSSAAGRQGLAPRRRDAVAAADILQSYLDSHAVSSAV